MAKKLDELRAQSDEQLEVQVMDLRKECFMMKNALTSKKEDVKPYMIQQKRRDVARILTILSQRQRQRGVS
jgi:large subunit ribosomal protein L29